MFDDFLRLLKMSKNFWKIVKDNIAKQQNSVTPNEKAKHLLFF